MFDKQPEDIFSAFEPTTPPAVPTHPAQVTPPAPAAPVVTPRPAVPPPPMPPAPPARPAMEMAHESDHRRWLWLVGAAVLVLVVVLAGWYAYGWWQNRVIGPETFVPTNQTNPAINGTESPTGETGNMVVLPPRDSDLDGLTDVEEATAGTDPQSADTDLDGLFDKEEIEIYKTDPLNADSDADGYEDGEEVRGGYNPLGGGRLFATPPIQ